MFGLETARLSIRPWRADDRPAFAAMMSNPEVTKFLNGGRPYSEQQFDDLMARQTRNLTEHGVCMGAVIEKSSGRIIGHSGTQPLGTTSDLEIGWVFAREAWGHGYATEAGAASLKYVLETLGRPRVVAIIDPDNEASKRVAARLDMQWEARYTGAQLGHRFPDIVVDLFYRECSTAAP